MANKVHQAAGFPSLFVGLSEELKPGRDSLRQWHRDETHNDQVLRSAQL